MTITAAQSKAAAKEALAMLTAAHAGLSLGPILAVQRDFVLLSASLASMCGGALAAFDEVHPGASELFLANMGRSIEAMPDA